MAVIDMHAAHPHALADTWFAAELDRALKYLTQQERADAAAWCSHYVYDQALARRSRCMNTTEALREFVPQSRTANVTLLADDGPAASLFEDGARCRTRGETVREFGLPGRREPA